MRHLRTAALSTLLFAVLFAIALPAQGQGFTADFSLPEFGKHQIQPQLGITAEAYDVSVTGAVGKRKQSAFVGTGLHMGSVGIFDASLRLAPGVTRSTAIDGRSAYTAAGQASILFEGPNTRFGIGIRYDTPARALNAETQHARIVLSFGPSF